MNIIYGLNDHVYLKNYKEEEKLKFELNYKKYTHNYYQLKFAEGKLKNYSGRNLLDYGCGSGFYMKFAQQFGIKTYGIEFSQEFASLIRKASGLDIFSIEELEKNCNIKKFDIIHFGHVLEHIPNPRELINNVKQYAHNKTIFIIDGPLENNYCLSISIIKLGAKIKRKKSHNTHAPQHLFQTNYKAQLSFFENCGLKKIDYKICEQYFPLPSRPSYKSLSSIILFLISFFSIQISKIFPKMGNVFHFTGILNTK